MRADDVLDLIDNTDASDLFDGTVRVKLHGNRIPLGDAAIAAAFLPADERDVILRDIRTAVEAWMAGDDQWQPEAA